MVTEDTIIKGLIGTVLAAIAWFGKTILSNNNRLNVLEEKVDHNHAELKDKLDNVENQNKLALEYQQNVISKLLDIKNEDV